MIHSQPNPTTDGCGGVLGTLGRQGEEGVITLSQGKWEGKVKARKWTTRRCYVTKKKKGGKNNS